MFHIGYLHQHRIDHVQNTTRYFSPSASWEEYRLVLFSLQLLQQLAIGSMSVERLSLDLLAQQAGSEV